MLTDTSYQQDYIAEIQAIQNVEIRTRLKGFIDKIYFDEGSQVKAGDPLFSISKKEYTEELRKATADSKSAKAELRTAELELQNTTLLADKNVVSKTEVEKAKANLELQQAKVEEALANESTAKLNLSYTIIQAPFTGVINRIPHKIGSLVDEGTLLTTISNDRQVFAYFNVSENEYLNITKEKSMNHGQVATLIMANNQIYPYKGVIETAESEIDHSTGNLAFRVRFENPTHLLKHGSSGKIQILRNLSKCILIPQKSSFEIQENTYVYIINKNNEIELRKIIPSVRVGDLYVVDDGLSTDDLILYEGIQLVKEGEKIIPQQASWTNH
jgi:membrane fusion protein (multidrug efflux system)